MIHFFMLKLHLRGCMSPPPLPKFELLIAQEGMMYKIWDSVYKIEQNKYKIMIYFSFSKSVLGGRWHVPQILRGGKFREGKTVDFLKIYSNIKQCAGYMLHLVDF